MEYAEVCPECGALFPIEGVGQKYCKTFGITAGSRRTICCNRAKDRRVFGNMSRETRDKKVAWTREWRIRKRADGVCTRCGKEPAEPNICWICRDELERNKG